MLIKYVMDRNVAMLIDTEYFISDYIITLF